MKTKNRRNAELEIDSSLDLTLREIEQGTTQYDDWHWGEPAMRVIDWNDSDMPRALVQIGTLIRLHVRAPSSSSASRVHPRRQRDTQIQLALNRSADSHVAYDPNHPHQRIYLLADAKAQNIFRQQLWEPNSMSAMDLNSLASIAGGRHGKLNDYPHVFVKPIGILTAIVYHTTKKGDGTSYYIHKVAEISGKYPILACDSQGRLWIAGGSYTAPTPGITD